MRLKNAGILFTVLVFLSALRTGKSSTHCPTIVKNIFIDSCGTFGSKIKRDVDNLGPETVTLDSGKVVSRVGKRQVTKESSTRLISPLVPLGFGFVYRILRLSSTTAPPPLPLLQSRGENTLRPPMFRLDDAHLSQVTSTDLGFEFNQDEIDELYNEIYERIGRSPWSKDAIPEMAIKCCENVQSCKQNAKMLLGCPA